MFKEKIIDSGKVIYSDIIPELEHFFTTRESSINTDAVKELTAKYLEIDVKDLINPAQTHSSNVAVAEIGCNCYPETDGLILTNKIQGVYLRFADCVPVILYDKLHNIGAISHAGWRGTVARIVPNTIKEMCELTNSKDYKNIYVIIGPAIDKCCYNVGNEVVEGVKNSVNDCSDLFRENGDNIFVDLKSTNAKQAEEMGVPISHIDICPYCTSCRNDMFFSYRKENGTSNRHNAVIKLK